MTISDPSNRKIFTGPGNGFAYDKPVFNTEEIYIEILTDENVIVFPELDGSDTYDYSVSGTFDAVSHRYPDGVTVTLNNALPSGFSIVIENRVFPVQETDYIDGGALPAARLETDIDRLVVMAQAPQTILQDLVRMTPAAGFVLPPLVPDALKFLRWNADGDAIETVELGDGSLIPLPLDVVNGGTGASTPAGARTNLELGTAAIKDTGTGASQVPTNSDLVISRIRTAQRLALYNLSV